MLRSILTLTAVFITIHLQAQTWDVYDIDFGAKPAIAIDSLDQVHIAYMLEETDGGFIRHALWKDGRFDTTLIDQAYYYGPLDIAISPEGHPHIAVHHHEDENEYIYRWDGLLWEALPVVSEGHDGWDNSLTFDQAGNIHTSSIDPAQFGSGEGVEYGFFDGTEWTKESISAGPASYEYSTCIQVDSEGHPHIVFYDDFGDNLVYAHKKSGKWLNFTIANKGGLFASMVLDENDEPHITYYEQLAGDVGLVRYVRLVADEWTSEVIDELENVPLGFTGARNMTALAIDRFGQLIVCYGDRKVVKYATLLADGWTTEFIADHTQNDTLLGAQVDLVLDSERRPHITFFTLESEFPVSGTIRYATRDVLASQQDVLATPRFWKVFPNPVEDQLQIEWNTKHKQPREVQMRLIDLDGKVILGKMLTTNQMNLSLANLTAGVYHLQIKVNGAWQTQKIVKL
ncbi:MAG: T9SS type A sorting domain-containing protein [Bacteroidota bacterium]